MITQELLNKMFAAYNALDVEAVLDFFADDAIFDHSTGPEIYGLRFEGKPAIREIFKQAFESVEHLSYEPVDTRIVGNKAYCEQRRRSKLKLGGSSDIMIIDILTFRDDKIVHKDTFYKNRV
jgi:ketosteroid isomerase-like protein